MSERSAFIVAACACISVGVGTLITNTAVGLLVMGIGCLLFASGILFCILTGWLGSTIFPWILRKVTDFFQKIVYRNKKEDRLEAGMKKGTKGMLIAAGAFAVAGIGLCIGGISVAAVETGGNVFDQAGQLLQDNDYPLAGLIHWGNVQYHSSDIDWDALDGNTVDMDFASDLEISLSMMSSLSRNTMVTRFG